MSAASRNASRRAQLKIRLGVEKDRATFRPLESEAYEPDDEKLLDDRDPMPRRLARYVDEDFDV